ncbi:MULTISPECIES: NADH-quinone oxidoreductase subunit G [unclassified Actinomyces]|uniref:NADH-quinone oxidoreductase subunit G n=1 Tax=unclassified Actinomyces TaxID=2609248 RepID=UPI0020182537|nr:MULTISPECIES: NADH-quinone oxidoreductase subunit G [unclassified Actinomyces]MCL3776939.1 NADH-quinone oxidoreductase subunit G [Actinomyces sp. AC-20-1]MCL3789176.1 NADH-quinone oxidoreductase subunit G [Actinomyces sp. 187325]MCL3791941.1 NADH-quinone oxidoreductase subunit G [Actinomyces sp. 186855]MCL3794558.1 NADH-quinone oxidoreductase subunit G [Actinomyces sp. 217892]
MTDMVKMTIDGIPVEVAKGTLLIRAAEKVGVRIPRFCDHPLLSPSANCRQCLVEVAMPGRDGVVRPMPKPQPSCAMTAMEGMEVSTQATSPVAAKAQAGTMEFLLVNHPLDCPVCDKGGECPLQNQALELMASGAQCVTRFTDVKRTFPKPLRLTSNILLDRDRCILCQRCVRFADQVPGDAFITLQGRGAGHAGGELTGGLYSEQIGRFDSTVLDFTDPAVDLEALETVRGESYLAPEAGLAGPGGDPGIVDGRAYGPLGNDELDVSGRPFASYFSGNIIQICPVGALTSARYRFRSRPMDLVSTDSVTEHDASGSAIRVDMRRGTVLRRLAGNDPEVNEEWITDKDRFAFAWSSLPDRLSVPLVRDETTGELVATSWSDALDVAARGLEQARADGGVGLLPGARLTLEDAWAWSRFARTVLGTNDIDQRVRDHSAEEDSFLAARVAGTGLGAVTYRSLERAGQVLLVGLEPEDECGSLFLRLRKGVRAGGVAVASVTSVLTRAARKLGAQTILTAPGGEARAVALLHQSHPELVEALRGEGATILVGERAAAVPGLLTVVDTLATSTGARLAWVPRRSGERGGIEAGLLPHLLPGGHPVADEAARARVQQAWGIETTGLHARTPLPAQPGRDTTAILTALADGELGGLVVGGVDLRDFPDPGLARTALASSGFTVQLEVRRSEVSEHADVVLPVAPAVEKNGTFVSWEGRVRPFGQAHVSRARTDRQVLGMLAQEMGTDLGVGSLEDLHAELAGLGLWRGPRGAVVLTPEQEAPAPAEAPEQGLSTVTGLDALLATHKPMLDDGRLQDGEPFLAATALRPVARLGADLAQRLGLTGGETVRVSTATGSIELPAVVGGVADGAVWLPECSAGSTVRQSLGAHHGSAVVVSLATRTANDTEVVR